MRAHVLGYNHAMVEYNKDTAPHARPSRTGLKTVVIYVDQEVSKALRILAIQQNTTLQALGEQAFDLVLASYNVKVKKAKKTAVTA